MKFLRTTKGQAVVGVLVPIAIAAVVSLVGSIKYTDGRIDNVDDKVSITQAKTAALEEAISTIKTDNAEIKADIKLILKTLK